MSIDKAESLHLARGFLRAVASGKRWSSIFISSVLNSVPFEQDRKHVLKIVANCCHPDTRVYAVASSENQTDLRNVKAKYFSEKMTSVRKMMLNHETNVMLGEISDSPKVQKYHTPEEFYLLDLNYTLVANSHEKHSPFAEQIRQETYRDWLVALLRSRYVILMTARPVKYRELTLDSIQEKTGWTPNESYFNSYNLPPPQSLSENSKGSCFGGKGRKARRAEGTYPLWICD